MKKIAVLSLMALMVIVYACKTSKKAAAAAPAPKMTYETNIKPLIAGNCSPCHIPAKGGNKKAYDNYAAIQSDIDEIIHRIELHPGEKGFMPARKPRLSDSTIAVIKQWKADGAIEK